MADARTAAGFSQAQLAERVRLNRSALSRIETGERSLDVLELSRIAEALGRSVEWFIIEPPEILASHRRLPDAEEGQDARLLEDRLDAVARHVELLQQINALGPTELGPGTLEGERLDDFDDAESLARRARGLVGHPTDPVRELQIWVQEFGLYAYSFDLGSDVIDGGYVRVGTSGVSVLNGATESGRRRFTLAHELGHHLLGDEYSADFAIGQTREERESLLNAFAIHLLMPRDGAVPRFEELQREHSLRSALIILAAEFMVSWSAACNQARNLGLIDAQTHTTLSGRRPTYADYVELQARWSEELEPMAIPPAIGTAALRAYRLQRIGAGRAVELLWNTLDREDLPPVSDISIHALRSDFESIA
ncbi:MAG: XRE family transcriptional regulator [Actinomycetota bacterium]|nr:XRE family transcriptional regulator [Actinomycetota bacterium]